MSMVEICPIYFRRAEAQRYELHSRFLNEQMYALLRGDRLRRRFCGARHYLYDWRGLSNLDLLSVGCVRIGRNHPVLRDVLKNVLDSEASNLVQFDVSTWPAFGLSGS